MQPYYIDIAFLLIAFVLVVAGWRKGFVRMAGGLLSLVISVVVGIWGVGFLEDMLGIPLSSTFLGLLFAFLTIAIIVSVLLNLLVSLLDLLRRLITIIPGLGFIHRLAGAVVGFLESGILLLGVSYLAVYVLAQSDVRTLLLSSESIAFGAQLLLYASF